MIVGNGLIASLFYDVDREDVIFFSRLSLLPKSL